MKRLFLKPVNLTVILAFVLLLLALNVGIATSQQIQTAQDNAWQYQAQIFKLKQIQHQKAQIEMLVGQIDPQLPGVSTNSLDILWGEFYQAVENKDFAYAKGTLVLLGQQAREIFANQQEIAKAEVERLKSQIEQSFKEGRTILADLTPVQDTYLEVNNISQEIIIKNDVDKLRDILAQSAEIIKLRRLEMKEAVKQVVIKKSDKKLYMYENGVMIHSMSVSLGRAGFSTRSGEFVVMDKLGTIWGYWQIWLPYWMGIYFAGGSENGIHGIPWDQAGHRYWEKDVGVRNVTYGCVMSYDKEIEILYNWVEVGTPVTIVN